MTPAERSPPSVLRHLAAWGLDGGPTEPIEVDPSFDLAELVDRCVAERITGVALDAIDRGALVEVPQGLVEAIRPRDLRLLQQSLMAEADLVRVSTLLSEHDVEHRVLKGLATAHLDHQNPALRSTSDVDLLVRRGQLSTASAVLAPLVDQVATSPDRRRSHTDRYGKDRTLKLRGGGWIDLHQLLATGYWGMALDHDPFFEDEEHFTVAGVRCRALTLEHRFLHALLHAGASDRATIQSVRDVAVLQARLDLDPVAVLDAERLEPIRAVLALGAIRAGDLLGLSGSLQDWASVQRPGPRERIALRVAAMSGSRSHWTGALGIAPHRWPGFLVPLAFPSRDYLDARAVSWRGRLRSAARSLTDRDR